MDGTNNSTSGRERRTYPCLYKEWYGCIGAHVSAKEDYWHSDCPGYRIRR